MLLALLGLSAKHLLLEPSHPGLEGLELPGQLCDLSLLITNDLFELSSSLLGSCFPFDSPGVHRLPVMGLLAEFDQQAAGFGILNEHAAMLPMPGMCVQPGTDDACRLPRRPRVY